MTGAGVFDAPAAGTPDEPDSFVTGPGRAASWAWISSRVRACVGAAGGASVFPVRFASTSARCSRDNWRDGVSGGLKQTFRDWACSSPGTTASTRCTSLSASGLRPASNSCCARCNSWSTVLASAACASGCSGRRAARPETGRARCVLRATRASPPGRLPGLATGPDRRASCCRFRGRGQHSRGCNRLQRLRFPADEKPANSATPRATVRREPRGVPAASARRQQRQQRSLASHPSRRSTWQRVAACRNMPARRAERGLCMNRYTRPALIKGASNASSARVPATTDDDVRELLDDLLDQGGASRDRGDVDEQHAAASVDQHVHRLLGRACGPDGVVLADRCPDATNSLVRREHDDVDASTATDAA